MKTILLALAATTAITSTAIAGNPAPVELPAIAPVAAAVTDWSGPYVGGLVSLNSGSMDYYDDGELTVYPMNDSDFMYGVFAGYQRQMGSFVVGGEVAYQMGEFSFPDYPEDHIDNFLDLKARLGFAAGSALIYATGGYTMGNYSENTGDVVDYTIDLTGFNVGAGVDFKIGERLFVGAEYLYRETSGVYNEDSDYEGDFQTQSIQIRAGLQF